MSKFHENNNPFVDHVHLYVSNIKNSLQYYEQIIGLRLLTEQDNVIHLTADGTRPLVTLEQPENVALRTERTAGLYHFALLLPERKDLAAFVKHLFDKEIHFGASDHKVSEAIYLRDPDGNGIEVYHDRDDSDWDWDGDEVQMSTDPLDTTNLLEDLQAEWTVIPEQTIIGHIHLHVSNLEETEHFYKDVLGFQLMTRYPGAIFMATGGYHHHIGLNIWNGEGAPPTKENSVGLYEYRIVYEENELIDVIQKATSANVYVKETEIGYVMEDPSKNRILLTTKDAR